MAKTWRCFFCDELFYTRRRAGEHFGEQNCGEFDPPACIDPLRTDEKARLIELREARAVALKAITDRNRAEELLEGLQAEHENFFRYFGADCNNMWQAGDRYKNAQFEIGLLRSRLSSGNQDSPPLLGASNA